MAMALCRRCSLVLVLQSVTRWFYMLFNEHNEPARGPHTHALFELEVASTIQNRTSKSQCCGVKWAWVFSFLRGRGGGFTVRRCSHDSGLEHGQPTSRSTFSSSAMTLSGHPVSFVDPLLEKPLKPLKRKPRLFKCFDPLSVKPLKH